MAPDLLLPPARAQPARDQIVELYQRVSAFPNVVQYAVHLQTIVGLVASGVGLAILPASAGRVSREGVIYRPLDVPDATSRVGLAWAQGDNPALVENFAATVGEVAESLEFGGLRLQG